MKNKSLKLTTLVTLMLMLSMVVSISTVTSIDENVSLYDCSIWSTDSTVVDLGTNTWPLLNGEAKVSGFKITDLDLCVCADPIDLSDPENNYANDCSKIGPSTLSHRGDRGLGVFGQINDQIDSTGAYEFIEISFNNIQTFQYFEIRSFYESDSTTEQGTVIFFLDQVRVAEFNLTAVDATGDGKLTFPLSNEFIDDIEFDRIIFLVHPRFESKEYSGFTVAKLETSDHFISFIDPLVGVDCDSINEPPVADAGGPYSGFEGEEITFDGSGSYDNDGFITEWAWSYTVGSSFSYHIGEGDVISYIFNDPGTYNILLKVTDNDGAIDYDNISIEIEETYDPFYTFTFNLLKGWNLITMPFENSFTAETLGQSITGCTQVDMFNGETQTFSTHLVGIPYNDFPIEDGVGYLVYVTENTTFSIDGIPIDDVSINMYPNWNLIGWYHEYDTTAESLGQSICGCTVVSMLDAETQNYTTHVVGIQWDNFIIKQGMGIWVFKTTYEICDDGIDNDCDGYIDEEGCVADSDGDGIPDVIDNCPDVFNPDQSDTDGDGIGDFCDDDDDNDGYSDDDENACGSDPLDDESTPADNDGDYIPDCVDPDDDNDGIVDDEDCGPYDDSVWQLLTGYVDIDGDGFGTGDQLDVCSNESLPSGYAAVGGDCDDSNALVNPGATEICDDDIDNDCDGFIDDNDSDCQCGVTPLNIVPSEPVIVGPVNGSVDVVYSFNVSSVDGDNDLLVYTINWGDGSIFVSNLTPSGEIVVVNHSWNVSGSYTIVVSVSDGVNSSEATLIISIVEPGEILPLNIVPSEPVIVGPVNGTVDVVYSFNVSSVDGDNDLLVYTINWGDGSIFVSNLTPSGETVVANHSWNVSGSYTIVVSVSDGTNTSDEAVLVISIVEPGDDTPPVNRNPPPHGGLPPSEETNNNTTEEESEEVPEEVTPSNTAPSKPVIDGPENGTVGKVYSFTISSTDQENDSLIYTVKFGDGTIFVSEPIPSGEPIIVNHSWNETEDYVIIVSANDGTADSDRTIKFISIEEIQETPIIENTAEDGNIFWIITSLLTAVLFIGPIGLIFRRKFHE